MGETESTRAVVYTRVNHAAQGNSRAVEVAAKRQYEACWQLAEERGFTVVAEYRDTTGAIHPQLRPALGRLLADLPTLHVGYVVVSDIARISRNVRELTAFEEHLADVGVALVVYGEGPEQTTARQRMTEILAEFSLEDAPEVPHGRDDTQKSGGQA